MGLQTIGGRHLTLALLTQGHLALELFGPCAGQTQAPHGVRAVMPLHGADPSATWGLGHGKGPIGYDSPIATWREGSPSATWRCGYQAHGHAARAPRGA